MTWSVIVDFLGSVSPLLKTLKRLQVIKVTEDELRKARKPFLFVAGVNSDATMSNWM